MHFCMAPGDSDSWGNKAEELPDMSVPSVMLSNQG